MSSILYYSNYCNHCKNLLTLLSRTEVKKDIHFLCIDKRVKREKNTFIVLENGQEVLLPSVIKSVPSLLLLNRGNLVLEGTKINEYILPKVNEEKKLATNNQGEPEAFGMNQFGSFHNDMYSFLDQSSTDLEAKGGGGMRQIHNYATLDFTSNIETPPDNYVPDKVKEVSLDKLQQQRNQEIPQQQRRM
jgi:hypothetical protein